MSCVMRESDGVQLRPAVGVHTKYSLKHRVMKHSCYPLTVIHVVPYAYTTSSMIYVCTFLGAYEELHKATVSFVMSCQSALPPALVQQFTFY